MERLEKILYIVSASDFSNMTLLHLQSMTLKMRRRWLIAAKLAGRLVAASAPSAGITNHALLPYTMDNFQVLLYLYGKVH